jgi:hypothetical protein
MRILLIPNDDNDQQLVRIDSPIQNEPFDKLMKSLNDYFGTTTTTTTTDNSCCVTHKLYSTLSANSLNSHQTTTETTPSLNNNKPYRTDDNTKRNHLTKRSLKRFTSPPPINSKKEEEEEVDDEEKELSYNERRNLIQKCILMASTTAVTEAMDCSSTNTCSDECLHIFNEINDWMNKNAIEFNEFYSYLNSQNQINNNKTKTMTLPRNNHRTMIKSQSDIKLRRNNSFREAIGVLNTTPVKQTDDKSNFKLPRPVVESLEKNNRFKGSISLQNFDNKSVEAAQKVIFSFYFHLIHDKRLFN